MKRNKLFILLLALFLSFSLTAWAKEDNRQKLYDGAVTLMDMEYYEEARAVLNVLGDYSDSQTLLAECEQKIGNNEQAEETGAYKLTVTVQAKLLQANHVGNEWVPAFYVNGQYTPWSSSNEKKQQYALEGETISVSVGDAIPLQCVIVETDQYPDTGSHREHVTVTEELLKSGTTLTWTIEVEENRGRYKGNAAQWQVDITLSGKE